MELAIILMMLLIVVALGAIKLSDGGVAFRFVESHSFLLLLSTLSLTLLSKRWVESSVLCVACV